jgi:ABC-2 type transport system ATP-binding protein
MGQNGSGKTSLLKCIAGLEAYKGSITLDASRDKLLIIWDDNPFYRNLSGIDNLRILTGSPELKTSEILKSADKIFTLKKLKKKVKSYSYGEKKKLCILLSKLYDFKILIMDEVTNGLDIETMTVLKNFLVEKAKVSTIILTGHYLEFYDTIVDDIFVINNHIISKYSGNRTSLMEVYNENFKIG